MLSSDKTPSGKNPKGNVSIESFRGRLRLRFRFNGQRYSMSLGIPDTQVNWRVAERRARQIEDDMRLQLAHGGNYFDPSLDKYKPESVLSVSEPDIQPEMQPKLAELWQQYVEARKTGKSPSTIRMYGWVANHLDRCPHKYLGDHQAVFDWVTTHVPADSAKRVMMHLGSCCRWAKRSDLIGSNPFDGMAADVKVKKSGTEEDEINPFTREERDRIIAAFKANRYYSYYAPLMEFLFFTGCRPSEAIALQWKHIGSKVITFKQAVVYDGRRLVLKEGLKTQKMRRFPVNAQLTELLNSLKPTSADAEAFVFPSRETKFIDWHNFTNRAWAKVMASLPDIEYRNPYQTRHTFCSLCREANIPSIQIAKWVGNSAQMIDRVYAKPTDHIQVPEL
ncbi:site-specific integrase [Nodosilinea sp. LEGE 07088]|uniref:site-specific integrase n=1 Tax=Nodosilinea sp. LEGE 07088 TaxID=2777968 RepID=UPI00187E520C|nr:site-specific integrase [Nodosilinea sp. LEGE 07088]MBE9136193.1 site-specific integrase [Nodosilinea sp. LEGE 07088]